MGCLVGQLPLTMCQAGMHVLSMAVITIVII